MSRCLGTRLASRRPRTARHRLGPTRSEPVYWGGPVAHGTMQFLLSAKEAPEDRLFAMSPLEPGFRRSEGPRHALAAASPLAILAAFLLTIAAGCALPRIAPQARTPMPSEVLRETDASDCLAVLLPGRWDRMGAFRKARFPERSEAAGVDLGLVATDAHIGYYRDQLLVPRLRQDVIAPLRARGTRRIWLVGTSLGGVGSIVYWKSHPEEVAGLVLIAPYLGEEDVLDEIRRAGSLQQWRPPHPLASDDFGRRIWLTLQQLTAPDSTTPVLLAYGTKDDLAPGHRLLARELPETRVFTHPGGHDWKTWAELWSEVLASGEVCGNR